MSVKTVVIQVNGGVVEPIFLPRDVNLKVIEHDNKETYICYKDEDGNIKTAPEE